MMVFLIKNKITILFSSLLSILFFLYNSFLIHNGHFHEDAYILFCYVENFLDGSGITYYPQGPHTEGATDFLWLVFLIILGKIGFNVGTSVIILNSIAVFIISYLINIEISKAKFKNKKTLYLFYPFIFLWIFQQPFYAALGGFSVFLYMALILLTFVSVYKEKFILYTPYLGLLVALFRPDGVIVGVIFSVIGFYISYKNSKIKPYLISSIFCFIIGISYFIWRYNYFGNLLPLPLYVKSHGSIIAGLGANIYWVKGNLHIFITVLIFAFFNKKIKYYLILASPVLLLFFALITATQSQNIGFRFQAPIFIIGYFILVISMIEYFKKNTISKVIILLVILNIGFLSIRGAKSLVSSRHIMDFNYINQFPLKINALLPKQSTIVLTEAGRFAYWNQNGNNKIIDIVGLNSEFPAKNTIDIKYLEKISPDVIMYHEAGMLNKDWLKNDNSKYVILLSDSQYLFNKTTYTDKERTNISKVDNASFVATEYLRNNFYKYDIFLVDYYMNNRFRHIYAFKKNLIQKDKVYHILTESFKKHTAMGYYEMLNELKEEKH